MLFVLAVFVVVVLMALSYKSWLNDKDLNVREFTVRLAKYFIISIFIAFILTFAKDAVVVVPAGHRGVIFDKIHGIRQVSLNEGVNFIIPFMQEATLFDIRIQKAEYDSAAASKDLQIVHTKVALNFHPVADKVHELYRNFGVDYAEKVIHPAVQEAVKATTARYTAEELITRREEIKKNIHDLLKAQTKQATLEITETYITDFDFSAGFAQAIESKQIAEQQALKAKRDLDRVRIEAEQKIAQAQAEAKSLTMQKEAITSNLIELRKIDAQKLAIEKWDGKLPDVILGQSTPFIDISQFTRK